MRWDDGDDHEPLERWTSWLLHIRKTFMNHLEVTKISFKPPFEHLFSVIVRMSWWKGNNNKTYMIFLQLELLISTFILRTKILIFSVRTYCWRDYSQWHGLCIIWGETVSVHKHWSDDIQSKILSHRELFHIIILGSMLKSNSLQKTFKG